MFLLFRNNSDRNSKSRKSLQRQRNELLFCFLFILIGIIEIETEEIEIVVLDLGEETDSVTGMIEKEIEIITEAVPETGIGILPEIEMT